MTEKQDTPVFRSGFVAIAGPPNAGKSTLLNRMLKEKISITSRKPQTTRNRILGVVHRPSSQLIFIDTPGVHRPKGSLNTRIVEDALSAMGDVEALLLVIDVTAPDLSSEDFLIETIQQHQKPVVLALNKIDLIPRQHILEVIDRWSQRYAFEAVVPISARHGTQVEALLDVLEKTLPEGPPLFPEDMLTDVSERFIVAEMIREKVFRLTGLEIPYATAVTVDSFSEKPKLVTIHASIHVERDSQKGIIIGKGGRKLKEIGEKARQDIERLVGRKVFLKLFVRVEKNWTRNTRSLRKFGY